MENINGLFRSDKIKRVSIKKIRLLLATRISGIRDIKTKNLRDVGYSAPLSFPPSLWDLISVGCIHFRMLSGKSRDLIHDAAHMLNCEPLQDCYIVLQYLVRSREHEV